MQDLQSREVVEPLLLKGAMKILLNVQILADANFPTVYILVKMVHFLFITILVLYFIFFMRFIFFSFFLYFQLIYFIMYFSDSGAKWVEWLTTNWKISGLNFF